MIIKSIDDKILLRCKKDLIKAHLYLKFLQYGIELPIDSDIDVIAELFIFGGYKNGEEQENFINHCISIGLRKSSQSLRNTLSKYVNKKILIKPKNSSLFLREDFIPNIKFDRLLINYKISHAV